MALPLKNGMVAPLAGSVDRNLYNKLDELLGKGVAPLAGSVDRNNIEIPVGSRFSTMSLPSRGAWIEIVTGTVRWAATAASLPSRGAWIEITLSVMLIGLPLSLPSRGAWIEIVSQDKSLPSRRSRSPRGERG